MVRGEAGSRSVSSVSVVITLCLRRPGASVSATAQTRASAGPTRAARSGACTPSRGAPP
ncbi:hypothetical protein ACFQV2_32065 [Actinokineospora soli]|uniref:Uncharacterized protein n=1 Tax=Actinokineospora soli TaxID=1048753 RepID=A0ABW2TW90_9PSEU